MRAMLIWRSLQVLWLSAGLAMLGIVLWGYTSGPITSREPTLALLGVLLMLSFPSGFLGALGAGFLSDASRGTSIHVLFDNAYLEVLVMWVCITATGWLQWFVVLPLIFRRIRSWLDEASQKAA